MDAASVRTGAGTEGLSRLDRLPSRPLPILYLAVAHLCLAVVFLAAAVAPARVAGFFLQPHTLGIAHLVTLGWLTSSILGSLYIVAPMALRTPLPARAIDYAAWACVTFGLLGVVGHFFVEEYGGIAWSGALLVLGIGSVAARAGARLLPAPIGAAVKLHILLAFLNLLGAAGLGTLLAIDKARPFLNIAPLSRVFAHAHLAAVGWASMMAIGVGYRVLPMVLPAAPPRGPGLYASAILIEIGLIGQVAGLLAGRAWGSACALLMGAGFVSFFFHVAWMTRHRRRPPAGLRQPDYGARQAMAGLAYAAVSVALGTALVLLPGGDAWLRLAGVYGACGLLGFLSQMVAGVEARLLPWFAFYHANREMAACRPAPDPHACRSPGRRRRSSSSGPAAFRASLSVCCCLRRRSSARAPGSFSPRP